jgi:flagellar motor switch protein FliM
MESLKKLDMTVAAEIMGTPMSVSEVLKLKAGDLIPLRKRFDAELDLTVDGLPRYKGFMALDANNNRVFQVTQPLQDR